MSSEPPGGGRGGGAPTRNPKTIVTHHAFRLDPNLLGRPDSFLRDLLPPAHAIGPAKAVDRFASLALTYWREP